MEDYVSSIVEKNVQKLVIGDAQVTMGEGPKSVKFHDVVEVIRDQGNGKSPGGGSGHNHKQRPAKGDTANAVDKENEKRTKAKTKWHQTAGKGFGNSWKGYSYGGTGKGRQGARRGGSWRW